jgi:hypothetical protein
MPAGQAQLYIEACRKGLKKTVEDAETLVLFHPFGGAEVEFVVPGLAELADEGDAEETVEGDLGFFS